MEEREEKKNWSAYAVKCCNPFKEEKHTTDKKYIRNVTEWMCSLNLNIEMGMKICDKCRKKLSREYEIAKLVDGNAPDTSQNDDISFTDPKASIDFF